jgi:hypothetical protein
VSCHAPRGRDGLAVGDAHDDVANASAAGEARDCAGCHDFAFESQRPDSAYAPGQRLQRTVVEWSASDAHARGVACSGCHFPRVASADGSTHASHALPAAHDPAMWAAALSIAVVAASNEDGVRVEITLVSLAGHAVPTGDLYRTLLVHAEDADHPAEPDGRARDDLVALRRHFEPSEAGLVETLDDRVPANGTPRVVVLHLPHDTARVRWSLRWLALDPSLAARRGLDLADVQLDVAEGEVPVDRAR